MDIASLNIGISSEQVELANSRLDKLLDKSNALEVAAAKAARNNDLVNLYNDTATALGKAVAAMNLATPAVERLGTAHLSVAKSIDTSTGTIRGWISAIDLMVSSESRAEAQTKALAAANIELYRSYQDMSRSAGTAAQDLRQIETVQNSIGLSAQVAAGAVTKMVDAIRGKSAEAKEIQALAASLGATLSGLKTGDAAEAINKLAVNLNSYRDSVEKTRAIEKLFGDASVETLRKISEARATTNRGLQETIVLETTLAQTIDRGARERTKIADRQVVGQRDGKDETSEQRRIRLEAETEVAKQTSLKFDIVKQEFLNSYDQFYDKNRSLIARIGILWSSAKQYVLDYIAVTNGTFARTPDADTRLAMPIAPLTAQQSQQRDQLLGKYDSNVAELGRYKAAMLELDTALKDHVIHESEHRDAALQIAQAYEIATGRVSDYTRKLREQAEATDATRRADLAAREESAKKQLSEAQGALAGLQRRREQLSLTNTTYEFNRQNLEARGVPNIANPNVMARDQEDALAREKEELDRATKIASDGVNAIIKEIGGFQSAVEQLDKAFLKISDRMKAAAKKLEDDATLGAIGQPEFGRATGAAYADYGLQRSVHGQITQDYGAAGTKAIIENFLSKGSLATLLDPDSKGKLDPNYRKFLTGQIQSSFDASVLSQGQDVTNQQEAANDKLRLIREESVSTRDLTTLIKEQDRARMEAGLLAQAALLDWVNQTKEARTVVMKLIDAWRDLERTANESQDASANRSMRDNAGYEQASAALNLSTAGILNPNARSRAQAREATLIAMARSRQRSVSAMREEVDGREISGGFRLFSATSRDTQSALDSETKAKVASADASQAQASTAASSQLNVRVREARALAAASEEGAAAVEKASIAERAYAQSLTGSGVSQAAYIKAETEIAALQRTKTANETIRNNQLEADTARRLSDAWTIGGASIAALTADMTAFNMVQKGQIKDVDQLRVSLSLLMKTVADYRVQNAQDISGQADRLKSGAAGLGATNEFDAAKATQRAQVELQYARQIQDAEVAARRAQGEDAEKAERDLEVIKQQRDEKIRLNEQEQEQNRLIGERKALRQSEDAIAIAQKELELAGQMPEVRERELTVLRKRLEMMRQTGTLDAAQEQTIRNEATAAGISARAKKINDEVDRFAQRTGDGLADTITKGLIDGFEKGQSPAKALASFFKQALTRSLAEGLSSAVFQPFFRSIGGAVAGSVFGGSPGGGAPGQGGGIGIGDVFSWGSKLNDMSSWSWNNNPITKFGDRLQGGWDWLTGGAPTAVSGGAILGAPAFSGGSMLAGGTLGGAPAGVIGPGVLGSTPEMIGVVGGATTGVGTGGFAVGSATAQAAALEATGAGAIGAGGAGAGGLGGALAAAGPYIAAAVAIYAIAQSLINSKPQTHAGSFEGQIKAGNLLDFTGNDKSDKGDAILSSLQPQKKALQTYLSKLAEETGADFTSSTLGMITGEKAGKQSGGYVTRRVGGADDPKWRPLANFEFDPTNPTSMDEALTKASIQIMKDAADGMSAAMRGVANASTATTTALLAQDIAWAKWYDDLGSVTKGVASQQAAMDQLKTSFDTNTAKAEQFGVALKPIQDAYDRDKSALIKSFGLSMDDRTAALRGTGGSQGASAILGIDKQRTTDLADIQLLYKGEEATKRTAQANDIFNVSIERTLRAIGPAGLTSVMEALADRTDDAAATIRNMIPAAPAAQRSDFSASSVDRLLQARGYGSSSSFAGLISQRTTDLASVGALFSGADAARETSNINEIFNASIRNLLKNMGPEGLSGVMDALAGKTDDASATIRNMIPEVRATQRRDFLLGMSAQVMGNSGLGVFNTLGGLAQQNTADRQMAGRLGITDLTLPNQAFSTGVQSALSSITDPTLLTKIKDYYGPNGAGGAMEGAAVIADLAAAAFDKLTKSLKLAADSAYKAGVEAEHEVTRQQRLQDAEAKLNETRSVAVGMIQEQMGIQKQAQDGWLNIVKSMKDYGESLKVSEFSPLSPLQKMQEAKRQYEDTLALAKGGDIEAAQKLNSKGDSYLRLYQGYFASSSTGGYDEVTQVTNEMKNYAQEQADTAKDSLAVLKLQLQEAQGNTVQFASIEAALLQLKLDQKAVTGLATPAQTALSRFTNLASGYRDTLAGSTGPLDMTVYAGVAGRREGILDAATPDELRTIARQYYPTIDAALSPEEIRSKIRSFDAQVGMATTGSFTVGGIGGPDSQRVTMRLTPGEIVDVRRPYQPANDNGKDVASLIAETNRMLGVLLQVVGRSGDMSVDGLRALSDAQAQLAQKIARIPPAA